MLTTFTSESVSAGHPDKICDQISDQIVDAALAQDQFSRVAVETLVTENLVVLAGEVTSQAKLDYEAIARAVIKNLGYTDPQIKFSHRSPILVKIHQQSPDIAAGVDQKGAGDQGMMFGYACRETADFMPLPIEIAHKLMMTADGLKKNRSFSFLKPDGKAQVTVNYQKGRPTGIERVVLAIPHDQKIKTVDLKDCLYQNVVVPVLADYDLKIPQTKLVVNGTGVWHLPGPAADTGVTGRKIIVDSYGGLAKVGGGAFSGKDPTKVDRSGAYAARFLAKNIVAAGLADRCEVRLAYFIGGQKPVMQEVETFGTARKSHRAIVNFMKSILDTSVEGILNTLNLCRPIYFQTAAYGHFGRPEFPWEKLVV